MKPGDLVRVQGDIPHFLYGGDEKPWDERGFLIPTDIPFGFPHVGLVLKEKASGPWVKLSYVKLLTPNGIGWIFEKYLELMQNET